MKVKHKQLYSNECGKYATLNLLDRYKIKVKDIDINLEKEGITISSIKSVLEKYFYNVKSISFDSSLLKDIKHFKPYIAIITNNDVYHYVVVYKKTKKYLYILDSLCDYSYKITYENFALIDSKKAIVVEDIKEVKYSLFNYPYLCINFIFSFIESTLALSTTILIQQIIDNGYKDALFYLAVQLILLLVTSIKVRLFLRTFKKLDNKLILPSLTSIFKLKDSYINSHEEKELFYRVNDAYSLKGMILNFYFNITGDIMLFLFTIILMFYYSIIVGIITLFLSIIAIVISLFIASKEKLKIEDRRVAEYDFIENFKVGLKKYYENKDEDTYKRSFDKLKSLTIKDYNLERLTNFKNVFLVYFQSIILLLVIFLYFSNLYTYISIGSLVALINLISLVLNPILNICSQTSTFSNYKLIKKRLTELNKNV